MLFVINAEGVPSVARIITVAAGNPPPNQNPEAVLDADSSTGPAPLSVSFDGRRSEDPDGDPLTYSWSFGDGVTSTAGSVTHTYSEPGTYTASLTVSDGLGGTATANWPVSVREPGPVDPDPGDPDPGNPDPTTPGLPGPIAPVLPEPIAPESPDTHGPSLRLLGVSAARGRIRGTVTDPSGVSAVQVALRARLGGDDCAWWLAAKRRMSVAPRRCVRPRWINARLASTSGEVRWLLALGKRLRPGTFRVLVRAADTEGNESALPLKRDSLVRVRPSRR